MPGQRPTGVRIFIEPSGFQWLNLGDALMLETALRRIRSLQPDASITVHTVDPEALAGADPAALPLVPTGAWAWSADSVRRGSATLLDPLRRHAPRAMRILARSVQRALGRDVDLVDRYLDAVRGSDLTLVTGAGFLNDAFKAHSFVALESLELAMQAGAKTALVGQGLGPMQHPPLRKRAADVLRRVDMIALREAVAGLPLLDAFGVARDRAVVTGDDAIEPAYEARPATLGTALGLNLRRAHYAGIGADVMDGVARVVRQAVRAHAAPVVPIAVSLHAHENDLDVVRQSSGAIAVDFTTTADLLRATAACRVVVAGSYHAAVVALSMGIPVVAIAASPYYVDKFRGLRGQFGGACRVELAGGNDFGERLAAAIDGAWETAGATRAPLLAAAEQQIAAGRAAYRRLGELMAA